MSINSIGNLSAFIVIPDKLTEQTKRKLIALGIDPSTVSSESEALRLIEAIERKKEVQKVDNESNSKNIISNEEEVNTKKRNEEAIFSMLNMSANVNRFILGL